MSNSRSNIVDYYSDAKAVFTSEDMLEKSCFTGSLVIIREREKEDREGRPYQESREECHRQCLWRNTRLPDTLALGAFDFGFRHLGRWKKGQCRKKKEDTKGNERNIVMGIKK